MSSIDGAIDQKTFCDLERIFYCLLLKTYANLTSTKVYLAFSAQNQTTNRQSNIINHLKYFSMWAFFENLQQMVLKWRNFQQNVNISFRMDQKLDNSTDLVRAVLLHWISNLKYNIFVTKIINNRFTQPCMRFRLGRCPVHPLMNVIYIRLLLSK